MTRFQFYSLSPDEAAALRNDPARCSMLLAACKPLATKLARVAGIYTPLSEEDERDLQGFHSVMQAHEGYQYEGQLDQLCSQAGLLHSDSGLLWGRVETLYREREPVQAEAEIISIIEQYLLHQKSRD